MYGAVVFSHHLCLILSLRQPNAKYKQTNKSTMQQNQNYNIHNSCFTFYYFGWDTELFSNIRGVSCLLPLSPPHLSAIWHWISRLFLQRLPLLGCITAQTPNLLRRLWPHWNASTNTQPLPLSLFLSVLCIFFRLKLSRLAHRHGHTRFVRRWGLTGGSAVTAAKSSF